MSLAVSPYVVVLTGSIGSGKTTVSDGFAAQHGVPVLDTDVISRRLTAGQGLAIPRIAAQFGREFITADGAMDRPRMRELVFAEPKQRSKLEAILHPLIQQQLMQQLQRLDEGYVVLVVPLLVASHFYQQLADSVLLVEADEALQLARVQQRSGVSAAMVANIIRQQGTRQQYRALADDVLENNGDKAHLLQQVQCLHAKYSQLSATKH